MTLTLTILMIAMLYLIIQGSLNVKSLIKRIVYAIGAFIVEFYYVSSVFLLVDFYSLNVVLVVCLVIDFIGLIIFRKKIKQSFSTVSYDIKKEILFLFLLFILVPFVAKKSENFDQHDIGQYFAKSIELLDAGPQKANLLPEYGMYGEKVDTDLLALENTRTIPKDWTVINNQLQYTYHGIPTWTTLLALSSTFFGVFNSTHILTVLYMLICSFMYFLLENISENKLNKYLSVALFGFMPIILYLAKTTLTELPFLFALLFGFALFSEHDYRRKILSVLPLGLLGFIHVTTVLYLPVILVVIGLLSILRDKRYGYINLAIIGLFIISLGYCAVVSPFYTKTQLKAIPLLGTLSLSMRVIIVATIFAFMAVIQLMAIWSDRIKKIGQQIGQWFSKKIVWMYRIVAIIFVVVIIWQGYTLGFTDNLEVGVGSWTRRAYYVNHGWSSLIHLNIVSIMMATGYIALPWFMYKLFSKKTVWNAKSKVLMGLLMYGLSIYILLRYNIPDTPYNYFVSRYYAIFIVPMSVLLMSVFIYKRKQFIIVSFVSVITALPFSLFLMKTTEFQGQFNMIETMMSVIPNGSKVLVENNEYLCNNCVFALREMNDNLVFNLASKSEIEKNKGDTDLYILTVSDFQDMQYEKIYETIFQSNRDILTYDSSIIYPHKDIYKLYNISIYQYIGG